MLNNFLSVYTVFFTSDFFAEYMLLYVALGMIPSVIYIVWLICRGYVK